MLNSRKFSGYKIVILTTILLLYFPIILFAQDDLLSNEFGTSAADSTESPGTLEASPKLNDTDVKLFIDKIEVIGQLEKPQALFILPGSTPDIDDIQIEHSFFKEIFRPVEKRGRIQTKINIDPSKDRKDYIPW